ncbi:MAG: DNA polymerase III subunit gamma/tau, partial [Enterococcus sp.]|nr:DNA polymerase III subunit gamma/tau [Enterococcus sp.]
YSEGQLKIVDALEVTGGLTAEKMDSLVEAWQKQQTALALEQLNEVLADGKEARRLLENLLTYCRDLLIYQQAPRMLVEKSVTLTNDFKQLAQVVTPSQVYEWIQILNDTQNDVRLTTNPKIYLEVAMVKLTNSTPQGASVQNAPLTSAQLPELEQLKVTIQQLQKEIQALKTQQSTQVPVAKETPTTRKAKTTGVSYRLPKEKVYRVLKGATKNHLVQVRQVWEELLTYFTPTHRAMLKSSEVKAASPDGIVIAFEYEIICQRAANDEELKLMVHNQFSRLITDYAPEVVFIPKENWGQLRQEYLESYHTISDESAPVELDGLEEQQAPIDTKKTDLVVEKAQELFGELATIIENEE